MKALGQVLLWSMTGLVPFAVLVALGATRPYVPDRALAAAAAAAGDAPAARVAMFDVLKACSRLRGFRAEDIGARLAVLHALENDRGLLSTTTLRCDAGRCTVAATALIPHAARPDTCWRRPGAVYGDRRRSYADWFAD